jgi:hypothetical protein
MSTVNILDRGIHVLSDNDTVSLPAEGNGRFARARAVLRRRWLYVAVAAAVAIGGTVAASSVQAASAQSAPAACLSGYVCLVLSPSGTGNVALVAAAQTQEFPSPGLAVTELYNQTSDVYCLEENASNGATIFGVIDPGSTETTSYTVQIVFPGPACPG